MKVTVFFKNGTILKGKISKKEAKRLVTIIEAIKEGFKEGTKGYISFDNTLIRIEDISAFKIKGI